MAVNNDRPSLDVLVPLVMIEDSIEAENSNDLPCETPKGYHSLILYPMQFD